MLVSVTQPWLTMVSQPTGKLMTSIQ